MPRKNRNVKTKPLDVAGQFVRDNGLGACCIQTVSRRRKAGPAPSQMETLNCDRHTCTNRMWFRNGKWEYFSFKTVGRHDDAERRNGSDG